VERVSKVLRQDATAKAIENIAPASDSRQGTTSQVAERLAGLIVSYQGMTLVMP